MGGELWLPTFATQPLSDDFPSHGYKLLKIVDHIWNITLDDWQRWLIIRALEVFPPGHARAGKLRYRQVVISLARQNGKSELAAIFGLYGLLQPNAQVIGIAQTVAHANIVYKRVRKAIMESGALSKRYQASGTRGIRAKDLSGEYQVKPGGEEKLNSLPMTLCLYDELHLIEEASYNQALTGTSGVGGTIIGITTAGDDNSVLLKKLYEEGRRGTNERFGFFLWEAPIGAAVDDPAALIAANPAIACGRLDLDEEVIAVRQMPEHMARRYRLNQFIANESGWLPLNLWHQLDHAQPDRPSDVIYGVARTKNYEHASVVAAFKRDGRVYVELVASLTNPSEDALEALCMELRRTRPLKFVMEGATLKGLSDKLRARGVPTEYNTSGQLPNVCATTYALITEKRLVHANDPLINAQVPRGVAVNVGDGWRISPQKSAGDVDALMAMVQAAHAAETTTKKGASMYLDKAS